MIPFDKQMFKQELFSYVVLKKGPRSSENPDWPRLLEEPVVRKRHVVCRLCMANGSVKETVVTKNNVSQTMYRAARKSLWGDLLPVKEIQADPEEMKDVDTDTDTDTDENDTEENSK
jgi:ribosomal protein RSM22 (predicted rRNA methylase)